MTRRRNIGLKTAIAGAIEFEMERDPRVVVIGVDSIFGVFGVTRGLVEQFGEKRVLNTPISEYAITGTAAGAAMTGLRPVVDLCFANFMYTAWDQISNQLAKLPYMTDGLLRIPVVLIACTGAAGGNAAQHSDCPVAGLVNTSSLTVVYVSTREDAAGLMASAIRSDDPVVFLYPLSLGTERAEIETGRAIPFGVARLRREGTDVTCWAAGLMARRAMEAAAVLETEGISVEVIDPRTLNPLDQETVLTSVAKTGRLVAVDEARRSCSTASEIVARVASLGFDSLRTPPVVVAAPDNVQVPYAPELETRVIPSVKRIVEACRSVVGAPVAPPS